MVEVKERHKQEIIGNIHGKIVYSDGTVQENHPVEESSKEAKPHISKIEDQLSKIKSFLKRNPNRTMKDISKGTGIKINTITWRMKDLRESGEVIRLNTYGEMRWKLK